MNKRSVLLLLCIILTLLTGCKRELENNKETNPLLQDGYNIIGNWTLYLVDDDDRTKKDGEMTINENGAMHRTGGEENNYTKARWQLTKVENEVRLYFGDSRSQLHNQVVNNGDLYYVVTTTDDGYRLLMGKDQSHGFDLVKMKKRK